jgi:Uma2 family endonuclease
MLVEEIIETREGMVEEEMPSYIHSYLCAEIIEQLLQNKAIRPFPELTLAIGNGLTPDISVYPRSEAKPDFLSDIHKFPEMPILAIEVISASQNIQDLIEKSQLLIDNGVKAVWTIEPFTNTVMVTTKEGIKRFHNQEIENEGIQVDFSRIFSTN